MYGGNREQLVKNHVLISITRFRQCLLRRIYEVETTHLPDIRNELKLNTSKLSKTQIVPI
jgi:hypothetical protein